MSKHRKGGHSPMSALKDFPRALARRSDSRVASSSKRHKTRDKVVAGVVAVGAFGAIGQPLAANAADPANQSVRPGAETHKLAAPAPPPVELLPAQPAFGPTPQQLDQARAMEQARMAKAAADRKAAEDAARQAAAKAADAAAAAKAGKVNSSGYSKPSDGRLSSGYGMRSGSSHKGLDVANDIGTPIHSVSAGEVIDAGPASGFGQWVRVKHDDDKITVYGHINTIDVDKGQRVQAGQQIATMGNKGQSTGPHLHFEVISDGEKVNPQPWMEERGIAIK